MDKPIIPLLPLRLLRILPSSKERHEPIDDFIQRNSGSLVMLRALERAGAVGSRNAGETLFFRRTLLGDCVIGQLSDRKLDDLDDLEAAAERRHDPTERWDQAARELLNAD